MSPRGAVETPCIAVCEIDRALQQCRGCYRTLREIGTWLQFTDEERHTIMTELPQRRAQALTRRAASRAEQTTKT
jgi:uncharacterized protein